MHSLIGYLHFCSERPDQNLCLFFFLDFCCVFSGTLCMLLLNLFFSYMTHLCAKKEFQKRKQEE